MKIIKIVTLLILSIFIILGNALSASADGGFFPRYEADINEPTQKAIILYEDNTENLILQVKYEGTVSDFAWVIPVPSYPYVSAPESILFQELAYLTAAWPQSKEGVVGEFLSGIFGGTFGTAGTAGGVQDVEVWENGTAGIYDYAIITANASQSLVNWLNTNGYFFPTDRQEVIDSYIAKSWYFVAIKINAEEKAEGLNEGTVQPIELSFSSDKIIYPLKISSVSSDASDVLLYVFSDQMVIPNEYPSLYLHTPGQVISLERERSYEVSYHFSSQWDWDFKNNVFYVEYTNSLRLDLGDMEYLRQKHEAYQQRFRSIEFEQWYLDHMYYGKYYYLTELLATKEYFLTKLRGNINSSNMVDVELINYESKDYTDTDRDGWSDAEEIIVGTNPNKIDTDGDKVMDSIDTRPAKLLGFGVDGGTDAGSYGTAVILLMLLLLLLCLLSWSKLRRRKSFWVWAVVAAICGVVLLVGLILQSGILQVVGFLVPLLAPLVFSPLLWLWRRIKPAVLSDDAETNSEARTIRRVKVWAAAVAICGMIIIIGVFLPWQRLTGVGYSASASGFDLFAIESVFLLVCSFALILTGGLVYRYSLDAKNIKKSRINRIGLMRIVLVSAIAVFISVLVPVFILVHYDAASLISYGLYASVAAAYMALCFAGQIVITIKAIKEGL